MTRDTQTHAVAYATLRTGNRSVAVMTSGVVTCTKAGGRWFSVDTGDEYKLRKINRHPYFVKGDWK